MGKLRIIYSCLFFLFQSVFVSRLLNLSLPFALFSIFVLGNLSDSLTITTKLINIIFSPNPTYLDAPMAAGTASVKSMVEQYNGICNFTYHNNIFEASVLLNPNQGTVK